MAKTGKIEVQPEKELHERVARAVARVDRLDATQAREKAYAEERAVAKARAAAPTKRSWWRLGGRSFDGSDSLRPLDA
jgi:hypothetical protein